jgi:chromosome segregation ATPase
MSDREQLLQELSDQKDKVIQLLEEKINQLEDGWHDCKQGYERMRQANLLCQDTIEKLEEKLHTYEDIPCDRS